MRIYMRFVFTMLVGLFALSTVAPSEAGTISLKAIATLFEPYGTIPSGDTLTVLFSIDDATGLAISTQVSHATQGLLSSTSTQLETNVFNDTFGGTIDAIAIGGGPNPAGTLGGIAPGSAIVNHIIIDLRGDTSVLTSTNTPTDVATWNAFTQRTLALPAPSNPNATTGVATIGAFLTVSAPPTISNANVQLRTLANGEVGVLVNATIEDLDGIAGLRVFVERPGVFGPFPLQPGLYLSPGDTSTLDGFGVTIGPEFIPAAQRAGDYLITVNDGVTTVSTTATLPGGLAALPAGGPTFVDTGTGLLRPTISIPPIPGASGYRISITNDSDSTTQNFDGVAGADLSPNPSIRLGNNIIEAGKFYRFNIDAFDRSQVALADRRSDSAEICYDPATGNTNIPCITQKDVHLLTEADGTVVMHALGRVLDLDDLAFLKNPPLTNPPTVPVTVSRGTFGPFPLTPSPLVTLGTDTDVTDNFSSARNPLDATQIPVNQRAGDYTFRAEDSTGNRVTVTRVFRGGLVPLPPAGPLTIDTSSGVFTPTISIAPVPGATHYRVIVFNDTDSFRINFDNLPGGTLSESPSVRLFNGILEPNKAYRIHMDAFNAATFSSTTLRSRSASSVYDPSGLDSDGDGIQNSIDRLLVAGGVVNQSGTASNNFTNLHLGGTVFGSIIDRADLNVVVVAPANPATGLQLGAAGGSGTARVNACLPTVDVLLTDRDAVAINCGSLIVEVLDGTVEFLLGDDSAVIAPGGAIVTIREPSPGQYSVENSPASFVPITLLLQGEEITVQPGAPEGSLIDAKIEIRPILPNIISLGSKLPVSVAIFAGANFNAAQEINQSTLTFGRTGLEAKSKGCLKLDLNRDRKTDLLCAFSIQESGFVLGDTVGVIKAHTFAGKLVQGTDDVKIISGKH